MKCYYSNHVRCCVADVPSESNKISFHLPDSICPFVGLLSREIDNKCHRNIEIQCNQRYRDSQATSYISKMSQAQLTRYQAQVNYGCKVYPKKSRQNAR